jgi:uncharacterized membrane protein
MRPVGRPRSPTANTRRQGAADPTNAGMSVLIALGAALAYGSADFGVGLASRRLAVGPVSAISQFFGLLAAVVAVVLVHGVGPTVAALCWGSLSGLGSAAGTLALFHGLSVGRMNVVATFSGVLAALVPAVVGIAMGNRLSPAALAGIIIAIPAIGFVGWQPNATDQRAVWTAVMFGCLAGLSYSLLFVALDRAGTQSGAWPLIPGQAISVALVTPFVRSGLKASPKPSGATWILAICAGLVGGTGNLLYLAAVGRGRNQPMVWR